MHFATSTGPFLTRLVQWSSLHHPRAGQDRRSRVSRAGRRRPLPRAVHQRPRGPSTDARDGGPGSARACSTSSYGALWASSKFSIAARRASRSPASVRKCKRPTLNAESRCAIKRSCRKSLSVMVLASIRSHRLPRHPLVARKASMGVRSDTSQNQIATIAANVSRNRRCSSRRRRSGGGGPGRP
jgi:hypothetical protein